MKRTIHPPPRGTDEEATTEVELTKAEVLNHGPYVATWCAKEIRYAARKEKPNALDLHNAAVQLTVRLAERMAYQEETGDYGGAGSYIASEDLANCLPLIMVDATQSDRRRARVMTHEIATHLQRTRVAKELFNADLVTCEALDGSRVRHLIARDVEHIIFDDGEPEF